MVAPVDIHFLVEGAGGAVASDFDVLSNYLALSPSFILNGYCLLYFDLFRSFCMYSGIIVIDWLFFGIVFAFLLLKEFNLVHSRK